MRQAAAMAVRLKAREILIIVTNLSKQCCAFGCTKRHMYLCVDL